MTSADVPSGKTSQSLAERNATGARDVTVSPTRGCPMTSSSAASGASRRRARAPRRAAGRRLAPRQLAGARDPRRRADVAAHLELVAGAARRGVSTPRRAVRRPRRVGAPLAPDLGEVGRGPRRAAQEHHDRRLLVDPVQLVAQPAVEEADHLRHEVDVRAGQRGRLRHVAPRPDEQPLRAAQRSNVRKVLLR